MFNNCDCKSNGELLFYNLIKGSINIIFDVGSKNNSEYLDFNGEVHYFDPVENFISELKNKSVLADREIANLLEINRGIVQLVKS